MQDMSHVRYADLQVNEWIDNYLLRLRLSAS